MSIAFQLTGMRVGPWNEGKTLAFFSVEFGTEDDSGFTPLFVVNDFKLCPKKDGGYWVDPPNRFRMKNGEYVKDKDGFSVRDYYWDIVFVGPEDNRKLSKPSLNFKQQIVEKACELYDSLNASAPAKAKKPTATTAGRKVTEPTKGSPAVTEEDDFPF